MASDGGEYRAAPPGCDDPATSYCGGEPVALLCDGSERKEGGGLVTGRFAGRVAVVTGAGSGLGRCTAQRLASEGAAVACLDVNEDAANVVVKALVESGSEARAYHCDVAIPDSVRTVVAELTADFGRLDVLCNVAGIGRFAHTTELPYEDWSRILAVNLTGPFLTCQSALPHLLQVGGNIVNVASDAGAQGLPYAAAYSASKGGLVLLTKSLAVEYLARGVRINAVSPGGMNTEMVGSWGRPEGFLPELMSRFLTPMGPAEPSDIAGVIAFVASDDAKRITGAVIAADGGSTT